MRPRLPALRPQRVIQALERAGFAVRRVRGSHYHLTRPGGSMGLVTVPRHGRDLKRGTLVAIIRQAGLTVEEFLDLL
ncbi:MAG: type II toxin-antitoxin system HicA family toxin [Candidatus Lambdaproteobacteria bacterium]|nr:type II toxin-antitoxin system HicA family toxin [Candidatus Lambdaproteobacteria bacterium]